MLPNYDERLHFKNGGSVISRRKYCPGSLKMEQDEPESKTDASDKGSKIHACIELLTPHAIKRWDKPDNRWWGSPKLTEYADDEIEAAELACEDILRILGPLAPIVAYKLEHRFIIDEVLELGGSADFAWGYADKTGARYGGIWDYKNGVIPVNAKTTLQLSQYAAGLQCTIGAKIPFKQISTHIFGPNFRVQSLRTSERTYTAEEIEVAKLEQIEIAKTALGHYGEDKLTLHAGDHCFFCKAKAKCPAYHAERHANALIVLDVWDMQEEPNDRVNGEDLLVSDMNVSVLKAETLTPVVEGQVIKRERPAPEILARALTDTQICSYYKEIEYIDKLNKAVKEYVKDRSKTKPIPGLKVVYGTPRRCWPKEEELKVTGEKLKAIGIDKPYKKELINIGEAERALKDKGIKPKEVTALLEGIVARGEAPVTILVDSEDDPRPAVLEVNAQKATEVFDAAVV